MQDRFRFRVWYQPSYREPIMLYDAEQTYDYMRGEPKNIPEDCFGDLLDDKDYIIMQCTGLKDKNGKLIYEGDILKDKYGALHLITWNIKGFYESDTFAVAGFYNAIQEDMEVIGNVYENEDLLNGKYWNEF